jgi:hypothetical protein
VARFRNPAVEAGSTNHLFGLWHHDSLFRLPDSSGRQGAQSAQRWTVFHQGGPRATLPPKERARTWGTRQLLHRFTRELDGYSRIAPLTARLRRDTVGAPIQKSAPVEYQNWFARGWLDCFTSRLFRDPHLYLKMPRSTLCLQDALLLV